MTNEQKIVIALAVGMIYIGENGDGEVEFIGNEDKWKEYERLCVAYENNK